MMNTRYLQPMAEDEIHSLRHAGLNYVMTGAVRIFMKLSAVQSSPAGQHKFNVDVSNPVVAAASVSTEVSAKAVPHMLMQVREHQQISPCQANFGHGWQNQ